MNNCGKCSSEAVIELSKMALNGEDIDNHIVKCSNDECDMDQVQSPTLGMAIMIWDMFNPN